jgi:hypothetical protein
MKIALVAFAAVASNLGWHLTVDGLGPVKIGMTSQRVSAALGTQLSGGPTESGSVCFERQAAAMPGVTFMFEKDHLTRISVTKPSRVVTPRKIGIGSTAADVRAAYGDRLEIYGAKYDPPPAQDMTFWIVPNKRGVRFETDGHQRVSVMHAGTGSISFVEGCA